MTGANAASLRARARAAPPPAVRARAVAAVQIRAPAAPPLPPLAPQQALHYCDYCDGGCCLPYLHQLHDGHHPPPPQPPPLPPPPPSRVSAQPAAPPQTEEARYQQVKAEVALANRQFRAVHGRDIDVSKSDLDSLGPIKDRSHRVYLRALYREYDTLWKSRNA